LIVGLMNNCVGLNYFDIFTRYNAWVSVSRLPLLLVWRRRLYTYLISQVFLCVLKTARDSTVGNYLQNAQQQISS